MSKKGIDVSSWQGVIDWAKAKAAGVEFAIIRATTKNGNADTTLAINVKGCQAQAIPMGFYKYSYAMSVDEAETEAKGVLSALATVGVTPSKDIILWADIEDDDQLSLGKATVTAIINKFYEVWGAAGYGFGIYAGKSDYETLLEAERYTVPVWIARYYLGYTQGFELSQTPNANYCPVAQGTSTLWGWQYTSMGAVDGVSGNCDLNECYADIQVVEVEPTYYSSPEYTLLENMAQADIYASYSNRTLIAAANGIENYTGTAEQNILMNELLMEGKLIAVPGTELTTK